LIVFRRCPLEEAAQVRLHGPPGNQGVQRSVCFDLGGVEEQFFAPHQPSLEAHLDYPLEEASEDFKAVAFPDSGETGMVGQRFVQVVSEEPADAQAISGHSDELAL
jgi:hypothetical protein